MDTSRVLRSGQKALSLLQSSLTTIWRRDHKNAKNPNRDCPLLRLPAEILEEIVKHTPPAEQVLLSQTCRTLRATSKRYGAFSDSASLRQGERLKFLHTVARDRCSVLACDDCCCLHQLCYSDLPKTGISRSCRLSGSGSEHWLQQGQASDYASGFSRSHYRHIEQTLKLARMHASCSRKQLEYLRELLKPYPTTVRGQDSNLYAAMCSPKVVDFEGTLYYLHLTTVHLGKGQCYSLPPRYTSPLDLCHHQILRRKWRGPKAVTQIVPKSCLWEIEVDTRRNLDEPACADIIQNGGGCGRCLTDITITSDDDVRDAITLRIWQCFGTETAPSDLVRRVQDEASIFDFGAALDGGLLVAWGGDRQVPLEAGWVRDTYEGQEAFPKTLEKKSCIRLYERPFTWVRRHISNLGRRTRSETGQVSQP